MSVLFDCCPSNMNLIHHQIFRNLSPIQKKIAFAALIIFSTTPLIYYACRFYFQARKIEPKKTKVEVIREKDVVCLIPKKREEMKGQSANIVSNDISHPVKQDLIPKKKEEIKGLSEKNILIDIHPPVKQVVHLDLHLSSLKRIEYPSFQTVPLGISLSNWVMERLTLGWFYKRDGDNEVLFHALRKKTAPKTSSQKHLLAVAEGPRKKSIRERLDKNRQFAKAQQDKEEPEGFQLQEGDFPKSLEVLEQKTYLTKLKLLHGKTKVVKGQQVGIAFCAGCRPSMEDTHLMASINFVINSQPQQALLFAVFDGHGGSFVSNFLRVHLEDFLIDELKNQNQNGLTDEGIFKAFKISFTKINNFISCQGGSTATVLLILNKKIWVANTGDSRTILIRPDGTPVQASEDTRLDIERYQKKIEKLGGRVAPDKWGTLRVNGNLAMARAFGNKQILGKGGQPCILPNPKITDYSLQEYVGGYVALACDGLYEVASTNEVGAMIKTMNERGELPESMAKRLVWSAIADGSGDNVSVMIIKL